MRCRDSGKSKLKVKPNRVGEERIVLFKHKDNENNCKWASSSTFLSDSKVKVVKMKRFINTNFFRSIVMCKITSQASEHTDKSQTTRKY